MSLGRVASHLKGWSLESVAARFLRVKDSESVTIQNLLSDQIVIKNMTQWRLSLCPHSVDHPLCYVRHSYVLI